MPVLTQLFIALKSLYTGPKNTPWGQMQHTHTFWIHCMMGEIHGGEQETIQQESVLYT